VNVPGNPTPLPSTGLVQESASTGLPASLVILLVALILVAAAGGMTAVVLLRRRNYDRRYGPVPPPRRPYDDQPAERSDQPEELHGPRSR
jgi:flagellar basal body-associated protein FliL